MTVGTRALALIVPLTIVAAVGTGMATGWWQTESSRTPVTFTEGEFAGQANPADIRGSYSLEDVSAAFAIPVEVLAQAFALGAEEDPGAVLVKEFEERFVVLPAAEGEEREIGTDAMRLFVARYLGVPYDPEPDTGLLPPAVTLVEDAGAVDRETLAELRLRTVRLPAGEAYSPTEPETPAESDEALVKGNTTFGELLMWGVAENDIRDLFGGDMGPRGVTVRTWCLDTGREFSAFKEPLQELVDLAVQ